MHLFWDSAKEESAQSSSQPSKEIKNKREWVVFLAQVQFNIEPPKHVLPH